LKEVNLLIEMKGKLMSAEFDVMLNLGDAESPLPMIKTKETLDHLDNNQVLKVVVVRESAMQNIRTLVTNNDYELLDITRATDEFTLLIKKL
jgi:TusA-related sulfurtransferase